jgi:hypothetical protein
VKEVNKVREYQKLLPFHAKKKERFKELTQYLKNQVVYER